MFDPDMYSDNIEEPQKPKKVKTFNRLDEKFQIQSHHDPEHIFPEEYEMIEQLKKEFPKCGMTDKALCVFLCARRHNMDAVRVLLTNYLAKRAELFGKRYPNSDDAWRVYRQGHMTFAPHMVDKHGRLILYYRLGLDEPNDSTLEDKLRVQFWEEEFKLRHVPLSVTRNGVLCIVDLKGFSINNLDLQHGREVNAALTDLVPKRMRALVTVNGGMIFNFAVQSAKYILSKKIMKRVHAYEVESLTDLIPKENLLEEYGGECKFTQEDFHQMILNSDHSMVPTYQHPKLRVTKSNKAMSLKGLSKSSLTTPSEVPIKPATEEDIKHEDEENNADAATHRGRSMSISGPPRLQMTKSSRTLSKIKSTEQPGAEQ